MTSSSKSADPISAADRVMIDEVCDAFESEWQRLACPKIEEYLKDVDPALRERLFAELIKIDHHWRLEQANPDRIRSEYMRRFPEQIDAVQRVIGTTNLPDEMTRFPNNASLGPFLNLQRIGEGGFGVVFRAWDSRHRRDVALKIPRFGHELSEHELNRFLREAQSAGSLDHPGIARVWDSGTVAGVTYIAYQFVEGENLKVRIDEVAGGPTTRIVSFVRRLAEAVHFAHEHGIVHRDIKPSNILLTPDEKPVLTDFGLALTTSSLAADATRSLAARVGSLDYMSPEQASGTSAFVDGRADLWSLGVLMYELLTGERPFFGSSDIEQLRAIQQDDPKRMRSVRRKIPVDLRVLVSRCLQKRPKDRLESCGFLAEELARIERGEPIHSRPVTFMERSARWCQRNPKAVATMAIIMTATVFGSWAWSGWLFSQWENEYAVQQLEVRIAAGDERRRELLSDFLAKDATEIRLSNVDLQFAEDRFLTTDDPAVRRRAATLLLKHNRLNRNYFPSYYPSSQRCIEILELLVADDEFDESLKADLKTALNEIVNAS